VKELGGSRYQVEDGGQDLVHGLNLLAGEADHLHGVGHDFEIGAVIDGRLEREGERRREGERERRRETERERGRETGGRERRRGGREGERRRDRRERGRREGERMMLLFILQRRYNLNFEKLNFAPVFRAEVTTSFQLIG